MAPPAHVDAWSMAVLLGQPFEYYYYYLFESLMHNILCMVKGENNDNDVTKQVSELL